MSLLDAMSDDLKRRIRDAMETWMHPVMLDSLSRMSKVPAYQALNASSDEEEQIMAKAIDTFTAIVMMTFAERTHQKTLEIRSGRDKKPPNTN